MENGGTAVIRKTFADALEQFPTPFYLFDCDELHAQIERLRARMPQRVQLCYAMKANPFIVAPASDDVERIEVCSTGEFRTCQETRVPLEKIVLSGVSKDASLLHELIGAGVEISRYTAESVTQYDMLEKIACTHDAVIPVILRLTSGNQFGMDKQDLVAVAARAVANPHIRFCGIQYFSGTQKSSAKRYERELGKLDRVVDELAQTLGMAIPEIEYGAGLPVEYFGDSRSDARSAEDAMVDSLAELLGAMAFDGPIIVELGRAIAACCGAYATRIVDAKCNKGSNFAIVDGGLHQLVYYGHAMALQQPFCHTEPKRNASSDTPWTICGSLCTTNDILAKQMPFGDVQIGDVIVFENTGAYCMTEGHAAFLNRDLPRVIMADRNGGLHVVRERIETYPLNTPTTW